MGGWRVALVSLVVQVGFGLLMAVILTLAQWWRVRGWVRRIANGKVTRQDAYARYVQRSKRVNVALLMPVALVPGILFGASLAYSVLAPDKPLAMPLGAAICVFGLAIAEPVMVYGLLFGHFVAPGMRRELRGQTQAKPAPFVMALWGQLVSNGLPLLFIEGLGFFYLFGWQDERWLLIPLALLVLVCRLLFSSLILRGLVRLVPLEETEWAELSPRIAAWSQLAEVRLDRVFVGYVREQGVGQVFVNGVGRHQMVIGAAFLRNTDWRQRDAVIAHELGHLRRHDALINGFISIVKNMLLMAAFTLFDLRIFVLLIASLFQAPLRSERIAVLSHSLGALVLFLALLLLSDAISANERRRRPRAELSCDRYSVYLTGDPLAYVVALHLLSTLLGTPLDYRGETHPMLKKRMQRIAAFGQLQQPHLAPWANTPVPANVQLRRPDGSIVGTAALASAPPPAPVPPRPWAEMPPQEIAEPVAVPTTDTTTA